MRPRNLIRKRVKSLTTKTVSRTRERHSSHSNSNSRAKYKRGLYGTKSIGEEDYKDLDDCFQYAKAPNDFYYPRTHHEPNDDNDDSDKSVLLFTITQNGGAPECGSTRAPMNTRA